MQILSSSPAVANAGIMQRGMGMISKEGMSSLWRGMSSVALGAGKFDSVTNFAFQKVLISCQDLHMPFTLLLTKLSSKLWEVIRLANTTLLLLVCHLPASIYANLADSI